MLDSFMNDVCMPQRLKWLENATSDSSESMLDSFMNDDVYIPQWLKWAKNTTSDSSESLLDSFMNDNVCMPQKLKWLKRMPPVIQVSHC